MHKTLDKSLASLASLLAANIAKSTTRQTSNDGSNKFRWCVYVSVKRFVIWHFAPGAYCHYLLMLTFIIVLPASASTTDGSSGVIQRQFNAFERLQNDAARKDLSTTHEALLYSDLYKKWFSPLQARYKLIKLANTDVNILFRAAGLTLDYTYDSKYIHDMQLDLRELEKRGRAFQPEYNEMYFAFVSARMFSRARSLAQSHPAPVMAYVPTFRDMSARTRAEPTVMILSRDGRVLVRRNVDLHTPSVIIVASPWCHFCEKGIHDIEGDPVLWRIFRSHATWIVPPDVSTSFDQIRQWDLKHPHEIMNLAYTLQEWPMLDRWELPTFYFFKNGKKVRELVGWPPKGRKNELKAALRQVGLI